MPADDTVIIHGAVPPRDVLMRFISENPDKASKREIYKAFGLKGETRIELKSMLRDMEQDGLLGKEAQLAGAPRAPFPPSPFSTSPPATRMAS